jgi:hypothetical protein
MNDFQQKVREANATLVRRIAERQILISPTTYARIRKFMDYNYAPKLPQPTPIVAHATTPPSHSDTENPLDPSNSAN